MGERAQEKKKMELLAPAGSLETFRAVLRAGADAVYLGGNRFGARAYADNFTEQELLLAIDEAHIHGRRVYLTVNTLLKEEELEKELYRYLLPYYRQGLDAVIVQDVGALSLIRSEFPGLKLHASTQMTVTGTAGASYVRALGADRVVTARELSLAEIREIRESVEIELECFVHGALCYCYSGQCLFSSMLGGRSGNRGRCAQPCRLPYDICDSRKKKLPGPGAYPLSPRDLCAIDYLPQLAAAGITSLKIEGRMKQAEYAAGTVSIYRDYLDRLGEGDRVSQADKEKLAALGSRSGFTDGYYFRRNGSGMITFSRPDHKKENEALHREIREKYVCPGTPETELKEKIKGILRLKKESPAILELSCPPFAVRVSGSLVQAAKSQPLSPEKIENSLKKTGNTPFVFEELVIEAEDDLFLPVQSINSLRRDGLRSLAEAMTAGFRREVAGTAAGEVPDASGHTGTGTAGVLPDSLPFAVETAAAAITDTAGILSDSLPARRHLAVSVERRGQLAAVLAYDFVDDIYLDSGAYMRENLLKGLAEDLAAVHGSGRKAFFILPAIFRNETGAFYRENAAKLRALQIDGFVAKSLDAAWSAEELFCGAPLILDHSLYTYNNRARQVFAGLPVLRDTAPPELNRRELAGRDNRGSEMLIYGRLPLMTSAQCIHANLGSCDKTPSLLYLKDRYGVYFPVRNHCQACYNIIYNSAPLMLFDAGDELAEMGLTCYRIAFTIEGDTEVHSVLKLYRETFLEGKKWKKEQMAQAYTRGHYKRGVE